MISGVALVTAQRATIPDYIEATGTVRAAQSAQLASQVMGTITGVNVHEGDAVRRGQVLISIDEAQPHAAYQSATAGLRASSRGSQQPTPTTRSPNPPCSVTRCCMTKSRSARMNSTR